MSDETWAERWRSGQTAFRRGEVHPVLIEQAGWFEGDGPQRVLVPLCGAAIEMTWLASRGHAVTGVEFVHQAVEQAFAGVDPVVARHAWGVEHRAGTLTVVEGDWFGVAPHLGAFDRVWDRGAMVALPPERRAAYAQALRERLAPGGEVLLIAVEYDPAVGSGPPWALLEADVRAAFAGLAVADLGARDLIDVEPRWRERGHVWFREHAWRITARR